MHLWSGVGSGSGCLHSEDASQHGDRQVCPCTPNCSCFVLQRGQACLRSHVLGGAQGGSGPLSCVFAPKFLCRQSDEVKGQPHPSSGLEVCEALK